MEGNEINLAQLQASEYLGIALWQWQSGPNPDPWAEKDRAKWSWQDYSDDDCLIIEEAFSLNKEIANLRDYDIDLKKMLQVNKKLKDRVRRVRRQEKSRFLMEISRPKGIVRDQKTMNQAFGTIQHFLDYIMKRTPEAYGLYQRLKTLRLDSKNNEFEVIVKEVVACIHKGAEKREKIIKIRSESQTMDFKNEAEEIIKTIKNGSGILGDFLKAILKVYTMETFICYWLNELLRSENWEEINVLTPYLVCLVYTFKLSEYVVKYQEPQGFMNTLFGFVGKQKLFLYRGAALSKGHLDLYNAKGINYFSWNGVTSTSRDKNIALNFIRLSLEKARKLGESKVGVFFLIETDFASAKDCEGMIDIFQNSCSEYPDEQEVILAPGTVFKLLKTRLIEKNIYEVSLRVKKKFEETKENIALLGTLQEMAILKDKAIIEGLPSQQSFRLLEMLKGNKLIRKLEIRSSGIEEHIMEEIETLRLTTNVKKEDIVLRDNTIVIGSLGFFVDYFSFESFNSLIISNKIRFKEAYMSDLYIEAKTLILREETLEKLKLTNQLKELSKKMRFEGPITNLDFSIRKIEDSNDEMIDFIGCIGEAQSLRLKINKSFPIERESLILLCQTIGVSTTLNQLSLELSLSNEGLKVLKEALLSIVTMKNLSLDFQFCKDILDDGLNHLKNGLVSLKYLQQLSLNFSCCKEISDKGIDSIKGALLGLGNLQHLSLDFDSCKKISDEGLNHLKNGLLSLKSLYNLSLNLSGDIKISDKGLNHIKSGLISLKYLQNLSLDFGKCERISDEGLNHLGESLKTLGYLQHLSLDFRWCDKISDEGLYYLKSGLMSLVFLKSLSLDLNDCNKISDEGLEDLNDGIVLLTSLQHITLNFSGNIKISDEGLSYLRNGLSPLKSLQHLSLNFGGCRNISDEGLNHLKSALGGYTSLQHLSFDFRWCNKISDKGLDHLKSVMTSHKSLRHLSLIFKSCNKISDEGLYQMKIALISLESLRHLFLDYNECNKVSDEGLNHLKSALFGLTYLQSLSLNFERCDISDEGLNHLKNGLIYLTSLQHLSLSLRWCKRISDEGISHLKNGLIPLSSLQHLSLNFGDCDKISNQGLNSLKGALDVLILLQHLSLYFSQSEKISDEGLSHLKNGLMKLEYLQHLSLNFERCKISDEGLNHLNGLSWFTSLQHLSLGFSGCDAISDERLHDLRNKLDIIPDVLCSK